MASGEHKLDLPPVNGNGGEHEPDSVDALMDPLALQSLVRTVAVRLGRLDEEAEAIRDTVKDIQASMKSVVADQEQIKGSLTEILALLKAK